MNNLISVLDRLKNECQSKYVGGSLEESNNLELPNIGKLKLNADLIKFYNHFNPVELYIPWTIEGMTLYSIGDLYERQYGYRWLPDSNIKINGWNESWLVIGDISSNPIIVDVSTNNSSVYLSYHGSGNWELKQIADNLEEFFEFIILWINKVLKAYHGKILDDDFIIRNKVMKLIKKCLSNSIKSKYHSNIIEFIE